MSDKQRVFIDSNLFLYAFNDADMPKHQKAIEIITNRHCSNIISIQIINEVSNNMLKKLSFTNREVKAFVESCYGRYEVQPVTEEVFIKACDIRERYRISYYDSIVISSALVANCDYLYSEDMQHQQKIEDTLTIFNPFYEVSQ